MSPKREQGFVLITGALCITVCFLFLGLAFDVGYIQYQRRRVQTAADAAVVGAAYELQKGSNSATVIAAGRTDSAMNGFTDGAKSISVTINNPPLSGYSAGDVKFVEAIVTQPQPTYFLQLLGVQSIGLSARAVALKGGSTSCIYALNPTASKAISASGNAVVNAACGMFVNSSNADALDVRNSSCVTATSFQVVGNYQHTSNCAMTPTPQVGVPAISDPLAFVAAPSFAPGACTYTNWNNASATLSPGTYCGGISLGGGFSATLAPGNYILYGGGLSLTGGSNLTGTGVTFYNTGGGSNSYQPINITGSNGTTLSAPTSGPLAGILFFQDRAISNSSVNSISGGTNTAFEGSLYFPSTPLAYSGGSNGLAAYTVIVADTVTFSGGSKLNVDYSSLGGTSPVPGATPKMSE